MTRYAIKLFIFALVLFSMAACGDDPTSAGLGLIPEDDYLSKDTLDTYADPLPFTTSYYQDTANTASSLRTLVGKSGNLTSRGVYRFAVNLPDSVKSALDNDISSVNILSAVMKFKPTYVFGESTSLFDVKMYNLDSSYNASKYKHKDFYYSEDKNLVQQITENDSTVSISLDHSQVKLWALNGIDSKQYSNYGAIMVPSANMSKITGIPTITSGVGGYPELTVIYEKPGDFIDTLTAAATIDLYLMEGDYDYTPENQILLRGGFTSKGILKYDFSEINKTAIITEAQLTLYMNEEISEGGSPSPDSLTTAIFNQFTDDGATLYSEYGAVFLKREGNKFTGDISRFVQRWISEDVPNNGLWMAITNETSNAARYSIYGAKPAGANDLWKEPRLILYYTVK